MAHFKWDQERARMCVQMHVQVSLKELGSTGYLYLYLYLHVQVSLKEFEAMGMADDEFTQFDANHDGCRIYIYARGRMYRSVLLLLGDFAMFEANRGWVCRSCVGPAV